MMGAGRNGHICPNCFYGNARSLANRCCQACGWTARGRCCECKDYVFHNEARIDLGDGRGIRHTTCPSKVLA